MSAPQEIPLKVIESVTNNFADENLIAKGPLGKIYGGQLSLSGELIEVAVRKPDHSFWLQDISFDKEVSILSRLKHENMVSIVGVCHENNELLIINKRETHGSLRKHLSNPALTWMRRLQISIGVVDALSYLHNGVECGYSVIHHNVNTGSILLDENWKAKISGFEYSFSIPAGNLDLAYEKLGIGTYKSDVFSVGIVLFQLLCGKEAFISKNNNSFQASLAIFHYENKKLHEFVDPVLFRQMGQQSFNMFSETAYKCLVDKRAPPSMNQVLERLEKALKFQQMHENNEHEAPVAIERVLPDHLKLKLKSLEHMRIRLAAILNATKKYDPVYLITSGGYGSVYKAKLDHVDKAYCLAIKGENECEVPKTHNEVAIKRIIGSGNEMAEHGFYAEIEMLTSCKHSNIIPLLGFCDEGPDMILIYEYAPNGSLNYHIQNMSNNHNYSWAQRLKICINAAKGISVLHNTEGDRAQILHRDIKSANILLDENYEAKIGDFGLSVYLSVRKEHRTRYSRTVAGTPRYIDPQYQMDANLKKESDVYSFGVVLFEMLCGTLAYDPKYANNNKGLALVARQHFSKGTIKEIVDPKIKEEISEAIFTSIKGPSQESLDTFSEIAYKCLADEQVQRPTMEVVVKELEKALFFQETRKDILQMSFKEIKLAPGSFGYEDLSLLEKFGVYTVVVLHGDQNCTGAVVKRLPPHADDDDDFYAISKEVKILTEYKHENIISLLGYCDEINERTIVYDYAANGNLEEYIENHLGHQWEDNLKTCIDIAKGLDFLHGGIVTGEVVIHRNIKSSNILLDLHSIPKLSNFTFPVIYPVDQKNILDGTEYLDTDLLIKEYDIFSFGIILFEILLQRSASSYWGADRLVSFVMDLYKKGKLHEAVLESRTEQMKEKRERNKFFGDEFVGTDENIAPQSLTISVRIAIQCLHKNRKERPTAREVIIQLTQALEIQDDWSTDNGSDGSDDEYGSKGKNIKRYSLEAIVDATHNFSDENFIRKGGFGNIYKGQLLHAREQIIIAAKRLDRSSGQSDHEFHRELEILSKFKHTNVIDLKGFCDEMYESIIVHEYASNGSLDKWLNNIDLTWMKRLEICIGVASGLGFLHGGVQSQQAVIHRDIKSNSILLSWNWEAKISNFGLSMIRSNYQEYDDVIKTNIVGTEGYIDPAYMETSTVNKASDVYSLGVVLFEIMCGRLAYPSSEYENNQQFLGPLAKRYYEQNKLDELVFEGIKELIGPQSMSIFAKIAVSCLHDDRHQRPRASEVIAQLNKAKEYQVDYEMWELKLPSNYEEIILQLPTPEIHYTKKKEDIYHMLCEGILIQKGVWLSLDGNNKITEMMSATLFKYNNQSSQKWTHNRKLRKARFQKVLLMMDISNLNIQVQIKVRFLSPSVTYGVYLVFKFAEPDKIPTKDKYVNLRYKKDNETLHSYFATWRKDKRMLIELYRFLNHNDDGDSDFQVSLESFSRFYCRNCLIYVEGIEFRPIDNVTHEEIEKSKDVQLIMSSNSNMGQMQQLTADSDEIFEISENSDTGPKPSEMSLKKHHMLSAKEALYDSSNVKLFKLKPSEQTRFPEVIEVLSQQVLCIKCKIENKILSSNTDYMCYMIFKLSEKCRGLHCPVKVRGPLHRSNKVIKTLYFRSPNAWNIHDIQVPIQREDGWMEVNVWEFNSKDYDGIHVNLKLISYEETMAGLIVCGFEFRPL